MNVFLWKVYDLKQMGIVLYININNILHVHNIYYVEHNVCTFINNDVKNWICFKIKSLGSWKKQFHKFLDSLKKLIRLSFKIFKHNINIF